jgi:hypothetical protein
MRRFTLEEAQARLAVARSALAAWASRIAPNVRPAPLLLRGAGTIPDLASRPDLVAREREVERAEVVEHTNLRGAGSGLGWKRIEDRSFDTAGPVVSAGWTVPLCDRR